MVAVVGELTQFWPDATADILIRKRSAYKTSIEVLEADQRKATRAAAVLEAKKRVPAYRALIRRQAEAVVRLALVPV